MLQSGAVNVDGAVNNVTFNWELTLNVKVVGEEGEHGGAANEDWAVKHIIFSWELTLNVKVVGEEGEHGGAANVLQMEQSRTSLIAENWPWMSKVIGEEGEHGGAANVDGVP